MAGMEKVFSLFGCALVADKTLYNKGMDGFSGRRISPAPNYIGRKKSQLESIKNRVYHSSQVYHPGGKGIRETQLPEKTPGGNFFIQKKQKNGDKRNQRRPRKASLRHTWHPRKANRARTY